MPITLTTAAGTQIPLGSLTDLKNDLETKLTLGAEFEHYLDGPLSAVPNALLSTSIQHSSGNQAWSLTPTTFNLSGGITGKITLVKTGTILQYTDSFPTEVTLSLSTVNNKNTTKSVSGEAGTIYVCVELDFSITAGVAVSAKESIYGLSGNASTSDTFQVAFYKSCRAEDLLKQSIAAAIGDLVLPFHAATLTNLKHGDYLSHTANAKLQLGLGGSVGIDGLSVADQWQSEIPGTAGVAGVTAGVKPTVSADAKLAYSFDYAGTFEQLLWVDANGKAHLHLYRSQEQTSSLDFNAGITAQLNADASMSIVQNQVVNAPNNSALGAAAAAGATKALQAFTGEVGKHVTDVNSRISTFLKPYNQTSQITLDWKISETKQNFLLVDYTIDLTNPGYAKAWTDIVNGRFFDGLEKSNGSVTLDAGSGLERLYNHTSSISLNLFGQWAGSWTTAQISNSSLIYAGNNTFHLISSEGMQRLSTINKSSTEIDFYFAAEMDLTGETPTLQPPDLHVILRANNNKGFGNYIASTIQYLTSGTAGQSLAQRVKMLAQAPNTTQVLQLTFKPNAYANLSYSQDPRADSTADQANYQAFAEASTAIMKSSPANFQSGERNLSFRTWANWNIAATDNWPAPKGAHSDRKQSGDVGGSQVQAYITEQFGTGVPVALYSYAYESATGFMNLCEDLKVLSTQPVNNTTWKSFVKNLLSMIRRDVNTDFVVPATLALSRRLSSAGPQTTVGPAQGLSGNNSIAVTMVFDQPTHQ